jgi:hypothetical protein
MSIKSIQSIACMIGRFLETYTKILNYSAMDYTTKYVISYHCLQKYTELSITADTEDKRKYARDEAVRFEKIVREMEKKN